MAGYGFKPVGGIDGRPYNGGTQRCVVLGADTTDLYVGDFVRLAGSGTATGVPDVTKVAATEVIYGAIVSIEPLEAASALWIDGSEVAVDRYVNVAVATDGMLFACHPTSAIAKTNIGAMGDIVVVAGAAPFYTSKSTLSATLTTSAAQLQLVGFVQNDKDATSATADLIVRVAEPQIGGATASVGV